jgi:hypothetical protein
MRMRSPEDVGSIDFTESRNNATLTLREGDTAAHGAGPAPDCRVPRIGRISTAGN